MPKFKVQFFLICNFEFGKTLKKKIYSPSIFLLPFTALEVSWNAF